MSTYHIHAKRQTHTLIEQGGFVRSCSIEFLEGLAFETARSLLEQKGWTIVPVLEDPVNTFEFKGSTFDIRWRNGEIISIYKDDEEISWEELPEELKGLL